MNETSSSGWMDGIYVESETQKKRAKNGNVQKNIWSNVNWQ